MLQTPHPRPLRRGPVGKSARGVAPSQPNMLVSTCSIRMDEPLLSVAQVARILNISRLTIYRLIERGLLPVHRIARRLRFSKGDLQHYLDETRSQNYYGRTQA